MKSKFFIISFLVVSIFAYAKGDVKYDIELSSVNMPEYISGSSHEVFVSGTVKNVGTEPITSFIVNYQIDNGSVFEHAVSGVNIAPDNEMQFVHAKTIVPSEIGEHQIKIWVSLPGNNFVENTRNSGTLPFLIYRDDTERLRYPLIEVFTASTCPPCLQGGTNLKNVLNQNTGVYALIKYQMSWPGVGDPYYTAEGNVRRNLYAITGVPHLHIDGNFFNTNPASNIQNSHLINAQNVPAFMEIDVEYSVTGKTVNATATITPTIDFTNANLRLYMAITERRTVKNKKTNGEEEFFQVMKKFMPDASGITLGDLTADVPVSFEQEWEFKGEYRLPSSASNPINHNIEHSVENFKNLTVVAWVENTSTKQVYQAFYHILKHCVSFELLGGNGELLATTDEGTSLTSGEFVEENTTVTFTAVPDEWYMVKEWKLNKTVVPGSNNTNEFIHTITQACDEITVEFIASHYNVNFGTHNNQEFGTISATVDDIEIEPDMPIPNGSEVIFTATPNEYYEVRAWRVNGSIVATGIDTYTIPVLSGDVNVTIEFQATHFNVQFGAVNGMGTVTAVVDDDPETEEIGSNVYVPKGKKVVFTATPGEYCIDVKEWRNNGTLISENTTDTYTINSLSNTANVTVEYNLSHYQVTFSTDGEFGNLIATVDGEPIESGDFIETESEVMFTAMPDEGYRVKEWIYNGEAVEGNKTTQFIVESLAEFVTLSVEFEEDVSINRQQISDVNIYPNPVGDKLRIVQKTANKAKIEIFTLSGILLKSLEVNQQTTELDVSDLIQGVYLIKIINGETESVLRFVKE
ncbi:MAG: T9SS type A sorting domain-containing protein [Marinilabiliaceae bacterium]|nr:T9SS type A sorting domain-containing protein [Marinilabiliaceae bacterium]